MSVCVLMTALNSEVLGEVAASWTRVDKVYHIAATGTRFVLRDETTRPHLRYSVV